MVRADERRRRGRLSLYLKRALLVLFSFALSALLCELILRLAWDNPYQGRVQHERVVRLRMHAPLEEVPVDRSAIESDSPIVKVRIDERGYVRPTRRFPAADATVVFLGGSTTECAAVDEELRFPYLVSELLETRHGLRVTTLNAGAAGNTVHDSLNLLLNHVVADRPDVAVMMHATNDIGMLAARGSYHLSEPVDIRLPLLWLVREGSNYSSIFAALRLWQRRERERPRKFGEQGEWERERAAVDRGEFAARLRAFVAITRAFGIEPVLMTQPLTSVRTPLTPNWVDPINQEVFNHEIRRVAAEEDVVLIDLVRYLFDHVEGWDEPMKVFYDGIHVTNFGSKLYAEHIVERLVETVFAPPAVAAAVPAATLSSESSQ